MKKYFVTVVLMSILAACGGGGSEKEENASTTEEKKDVTESPDYKKGLALIGQSDCLTCHKVNEKLTGPSYREVSEKYAGSDTAIAYLAHKILHGGSGVWGTVPMTPHPTVSQEDAEQMVKYILLVKDTEQ